MPARRALERAGHQPSPASRAATLTRTNASSVAAARPSSMHRPGDLDPGGEVGHDVAHDHGGGRVERDDVADRALGPGEHLVDGLRVAGGVAAGERAHLGVRDPDVERVDVVDAHLAGLELVDGRRGGDGELVEPVVAVEHQRPLDAERGERAHDPLGHDRVGHADGAAGRAGRVGERAEEVEGGRRARARAAPARRSASPGGTAARSRTRCPTSRTQRATPSGPRSITTPSASSTSTEPHFDDAARPPCLATFAPAAAATIAAMVDTFTVPAPSPPVPQVSTSGPSTSARSTCSANSSIVRTSAASSPAVSPLARRPTANAGDLRVGGVTREDRPTSPARSGRRAGPRAGADAR